MFATRNFHALSLVALAAAIVSSRATPQCLPDPLQRWTSDCTGDKQFGLELAISGHWAVAGAPLDDCQGLTDAGAVFVYYNDPSSGWVVWQKLYAPSADAAASDYFGIDVDIDGSTIVIGARNHNHQGLYGQFAGAGYVFELNASTNSWELAAELYASDFVGADAAQLADTVAIAGTTIALGSAFDDRPCSGAADCGSVYVYERPGADWGTGVERHPEVTKLVSCNIEHGAQFGDEIAMDVDTIAVGAWRDDILPGDNAGVVYIFEKPLAGWAAGASCAVIIQPMLPAAESGYSVCMEIEEDAALGDLLVIGAWTQDTNHGQRSGAAYAVEEPNVGGWSSLASPHIVSANLISSQTSAFDYFGADVAVGGRRIVVGATQEDSAGHPDAGRAYAFEKVGGQWLETHWIQAPPADEHRIYNASFGYALALEGNTLLASAIDEDDAFAGPDAGALYLFELEPCAIRLSCFCEVGICNNADWTAGCKNSTGKGALLYASDGGTSVSFDDLVLAAVNLPPHQFGLFFMGGGQTNQPFGDGYRCVAPGGSGLFRYGPPQSSGPKGQLVLGPGIVARSELFAQPGPIDPGETWHFQAWYRDPNGPCGFGFNLSNAATITFGH